MKKKKKVFVVIIIVLIVIIANMVGFSIFLIGKKASNRVEVFEYKPEDYGLISSDALFKSDDGIDLMAYFIQNPNPKGTVIVLHGMNNMDASSFMGHAKYLNDSGYNTLLLDMRAHGRSGGNEITFSYREPLDVKAAINWLKSKEAISENPIFLLGFSMGGSTAIRTGAIDESLSGIVTVGAYSAVQDVLEAGMASFKMPELLQTVLSPFLKIALAIKFRLNPWKESPEVDIRKIESTPLLLIHGENDEQIPVENAKILQQNGNENVSIEIIEGGGHLVFRRDGTTEIDKEYREMIIDFFDSCLEK